MSFKHRCNWVGVAASVPDCAFRNFSLQHSPGVMRLVENPRQTMRLSLIFSFSGVLL